MKVVFIVFATFGLTLSYFENDTNLICTGKKYKNVILTAYFPLYTNEDNVHNYQDSHGKKLRTLQEYMDNRCEFITLAMDATLGIPYGTKACIPELNRHFGHNLQFEVRDAGENLEGMGYKRADICVRSEIDSYDIAVNRKVTLVFQK